MVTTRHDATVSSGWTGWTGIALLASGCAAAPRSDMAPGVVVAALEDASASDPDAGFARLRRDLRSRNPGYDVEWLAGVTVVPAADLPRVAFVQRGAARATVEGDVRNASDVGVGDAVLLRPLERLTCDAPLSLLVFTVVEPFAIELPPFLRPDFDPAIDDQRGGCATEDKPYRRLLLTWQREKGPYVYHGLNAHRVRIVDSFTHYHPVEGGFDELYLVQQEPATRRATLLTSAERAAIERPDTVAAGEAPSLLRSHDLARGELILIPRGVIHRGLGGAVVQVITIPGFRPGAEIGVDHHLRAIAERLGGGAPPFNVEASREAVIR